MNKQPVPQLKIVLVGNQNCGKTTLFNLLTNSHQKIGNWPGVTMEQKIGWYDNRVQIIDTPGTYSMQPFTQDESITTNYLSSQSVDIVINVVDCTNLQRNLYLTAQLAQLGKPLVVALNMIDEAETDGITIDTNQLQQVFGCKFFCISASKNMGITELMRYCTECSVCLPTPLPLPQNLSVEETVIYTHSQLKHIVERCSSHKETTKPTITQKIDKIVLNKYLAFPIFAIVMSMLFYLSIDGIGGLLTKIITDNLTPFLQKTFTSIIPTSKPWLSGLVAEGIIGGVMSVIAFVPQACVLFGLIALLEGSGYMSRIAFITDKLLHKIGLGGKGFICFILGCGCAVPAITAGRTIKSPTEKHATITLTPFAPCSAKMAIISFFAGRILGGTLFAISFYFISIFAVILGGLILKLFKGKKDNSDVFVQELPKYRLPSLKSVIKQMWQRGKAFVTKAGTTIFLASVTIWFLQSFDTQFNPASTENSLLASIGKIIAPIFYPLGFNDKGCGWQFSVATLSGIVAKETVISTLQILLNDVQGSISVVGGYVFVIYNLLTAPCISAILASYSEQGARKATRSLLIQLILSYLLCLTIYQFYLLSKTNIVIFAIIALASAVALVICLFTFKSTKEKTHCEGCSQSCHNNTCQQR